MNKSWRLTFWPPDDVGRWSW